LLIKEGYVQRNGKELIIYDYNRFVEEFDS